MAVITLSREFGSAGNQVIHSVAKSLNYPIIDKSLMEQVLLQYGIVRFDAIYESEQSIWQRLDRKTTRIIDMLNKTIQAFAKMDNVIIVGRGAFAVLRGYPNVLNVSIRESLYKRTARIMQLDNLNEENAIDLIRNYDIVRKSFLQTFYNIKEESTEYFNLMIDTSKIAPEIAGKWIVEATNDINKLNISHDISTRSISVDRILQNTVSETLKSCQIKNNKH